MNALAKLLKGNNVQLTVPHDDLQNPWWQSLPPVKGSFSMTQMLKFSSSALITVSQITLLLFAFAT